MLVSPARRISHVRRTSTELIAHPNPFDDQHPVFHLDVALGL